MTTRLLPALALLALAAGCPDDAPATPGADVAADAMSDAPGDSGPLADVPMADLGVDPGPDPGADPDTGDVAATDAPSADVPAVGPADWCARWSAAWCALLDRCPTSVVGLPAGADCPAAAAAECFDGAGLAAAAAAGSVTFDAAAAETCLGELPALTCDAFYGALGGATATPTAACAGVLAGATAAGGACSLGVECAPGSRCFFGATCPGTCEAFAAVDGACGPQSWCELGQATCAAGTCAALPGLDAPCLGGLCRAPLACDTVTDTCRPSRLEGAACGADGGVCFPGLVCLRATAAEVGTCAAPRGAGDSCFQTAHCGSALVCVGGQCQAAPAVGAPCYDFRCAAGWCDSAAIPPTCQALPLLGAACAQGGLCGLDLWCDAGQCAVVKAPGATCAGANECGSGRCFGGGVCVAPGAPPCAP